MIFIRQLIARWRFDTTQTATRTQYVFDHLPPSFQKSLNLSPKSASESSTCQLRQLSSIVFISTQNAHQQMVAISRAGEVLCDPEKRARYDQCPDLDEVGGLGGDDATSFSDEMSTQEYWRAIFRKVTGADIQSFEVPYSR